ncbi:MAG: cupin domain-containing protein [Thiotrichaceae bacterium]|nr:cupin domain-containing protein [Thiotrichaceae bacterium]
MSIFGAISEQQFLDEYWQQKPLLIRQAFSNITPPFSPEELAGLCCDTDVAGRIVIGKDKHWQVLNAPLTEQDFLETPETHWTLLVNDIERYYPQLGEIIKPFRFIPDWRIDDLMVSYAPEGGSVGPHTDEYDVFLIQGQGQRHWQLDPDADSQCCLSDCELSILDNFNVQKEWTLEAGDFLYLPPNLAHYGVAQGDGCMTFSIGFRAPSQYELLNSWLDHSAEKKRLTQRYNDQKRPTVTHSGEINSSDIEGIKTLMRTALDDDQQFITWLGKYLTEAKNDQQTLYSHTDHVDDDIAFTRNPAHRLAWLEQEDGLLIFINGEANHAPLESKAAIEYLCQHYEFPADILEEKLCDSHFKDLFAQLMDYGVVEVVED